MKIKTAGKVPKIYLLLGFLLFLLFAVATSYKGHTGKLLVATKDIRGSDFYGAVVYLQHHSFWSSQGFIINRPIESKEFRKPFSELSWNVDLYKGGPVKYGEANSLLLEGQDGKPNRIFITSIDTLKKKHPEIFETMEQGLNEKPLRLFVGYTGWGRLQINKEIGWGYWKVIDYDREIMFDTPPEVVWDKAMARAGDSVQK